MRPMRRKERQITEDEAYQILKSAEYATLCTINADDGTPYGVPTSYVVENRVLYIHMAKEDQKLDNLRKDPHVCMTYVDQTLLYPEQYSTDLKSAIVTGRVRFVTDREERIETLRILCEKYGLPDDGMFLEKKVGGGVDRMEIVRTPVEAINDRTRWRKPKPPMPEKA